MGFLKGGGPAMIQTPVQPVQSTADARARLAAEQARTRALNRRNASDTVTTSSTRRRGGLARAYRQTVGG